MERKVNVLLIDDRTVDLESSKKILHLTDIPVLQVYTANDAIQQSMLNDTALIIIDVQMPEIDGYEMVKLLQGNDFTKHVPIIFIVSAYSNKFKSLLRKKSCSLDFFTKPVIPELLISRVNMLLETNVTKQNLEIIENERDQLRRDIMEARHSAEQANYTKTIFLSNMSHEIRTPLNGILGMANILAETELTEEQRAFLNLIQVSGENLLHIINDILDFSKIEAGIVSVEKVNLNLKKEIDTIVTLMRFNAQSKYLDLSYSIEDKIHSHILGDPLRLRQILSNLINNAIKFTENGGIRLEIKLSENLDYLRFSVIDSGIGIDEESKGKLFREFSQADNSITRKFGGTGLGLAICKSLIKVMDGHIGLESELGKGSTFWFEIPYTKAESYQQVYETITDPDVIAKLKILVAEDNAINQKVAIHSLQQLGYHCDLAKNGRQAVELHLNNKYDVIFMDIQMPEVDGLEATISIRNHEKLHQIKQPVVIIAATANAFHEDKQKCFRAGMDYHLSKPFRPEALKKLLSKALTTYK
ncbi:MAG: response regulator [Bacteroidales bacterium]|jgi:signal transduction histidine kinase